VDLFVTSFVSTDMFLTRMVVQLVPAILVHLGFLKYSVSWNLVPCKQLTVLKQLLVLMIIVEVARLIIMMSMEMKSVQSDFHNWVGYITFIIVLLLLLIQ